MNALAGAPRLALRWQPRWEPLAPIAAIALGPAALALRARLARLGDAELARLEGTASGRALVVLGAAEELPWVDGIAYLGRDPEAPALLLPTALRPSVPAAWLERAIRSRADGKVWAIVAEPLLAVEVSATRPLSRQALERAGA